MPGAGVTAGAGANALTDAPSVATATNPNTLLAAYVMGAPLGDYLEASPEVQTCVSGSRDRHEYLVLDRIRRLRPGDAGPRPRSLSARRPRGEAEGSRDLDRRLG